MVNIDYHWLMERIAESETRLMVLLRNRLQNERRRLEMIQQSGVYTSPELLFENAWQRLDHTERSLQRLWSGLVERGHAALLQASQPLQSAFKQHMQRTLARYELARERLGNFSPLATLQRGYAVVRDQNQRSLTSHRDVKAGDELKIYLADGRVGALVTEIQDRPLLEGS